MEVFGYDISVGQIIGGFIGSLAVVITVRVYYRIKSKINQVKKK